MQPWESDYRCMGARLVAMLLPVRHLTILAAVLATPWCAQAADRSKPIIVASDQLSVLFAVDEGRTASPVPSGEGAAKVCARPHELMALYPGRGVLAVTGALPFSPARPFDTCNVEIVSGPAAGEVLFSSRSCQIRALSKNSVQVSTMYKSSSARSSSKQDDFSLAECFYRLALVAEGFTNGFAAPVFGEYPSNIYFVGKRSYVGDVVTPVVREAVARCPGLPRQYYKGRLKAFVGRNCLQRR